MGNLKQAQAKLAKLQGELATEQTKRADNEKALAELQGSMGALVASGKRTAKAVTTELSELRSSIEVAGEVEATLTASIAEAEQQVKDAQIVDYREQAEAKEKELAKHQAAVAKLLRPIFENEDLAGLIISRGKAETAKARELASAMRHCQNQAARLSQGLPLQPDIYAGLPDRPAGFYPVQPASTVEIP